MNPGGLCGPGPVRDCVELRYKDPRSAAITQLARARLCIARLEILDSELMIEKLLAHLADGEFHSGTDLARACGVSRTAVWQRVQELERLGIPLHRVRGRGYRVPNGLDLLEESLVSGLMSAAAKARFGAPEFFLQTSSTNDRALEAAAGEARSYLCLAEQQGAGRGRRGRAWASPFAANIYLSLLQRFDGGAGSVEGLSLAIGLAVARHLVGIGVPGVALKWPNDVLADGRKLAGVLIEISGDLAGEFSVVIGVGVNVRMAGRDVEIDQPWIDLASLLDDVPKRAVIAAGLIDSMATVLAEFERDGFSGLRSEWQSFDHMTGLPVRLTTGDFSLDGICIGVDDRGGIGLRGQAGDQYFYGGEISVREQAG